MDEVQEQSAPVDLGKLTSIYIKIRDKRADNNPFDDDGPGGAQDAKIAAGGGDGVDHCAGAVMGEIGNGEAEVKPRAVAHFVIARFNARMNGIGRLNISKSRNDDAPNALNCVEGQKAMVARHPLPYPVQNFLRGGDTDIGGNQRVFQLFQQIRINRLLPGENFLHPVNEAFTGLLDTGLQLFKYCRLLRD
mgnify:CR=1 FL=1